MESEQLSIESAIDFSNEIVEERLNNVIALYDFFDGFGEIYRREKKRLAYHINIIDELRANENAHSRILGMFLQHNDQKGLGYEILRSFINYIIEKYNEKKGFQKIDIRNPQITVEKRRIDLWIRERGKYAVIIENKVRDADDKIKQIERYIDMTIEEGYNEENIYVLYLPPTYEKKPEQQSWGKYYNTDIYNDRYLDLSFRDDILPWLKNAVLPNVRIKERLLISSLEQYIDHLKGVFSLRTINNKMNMKLQEFIKDRLNITNAEPENALLEVLEKEQEIKRSLNQLNQLKSSTIIDCFKKWEMKLKTDYPNLKIAGNWTKPDNHIQVGVKINDRGCAFTLLIEYDYNKIYYGIGRHYATNEKNNNLDFCKVIDDLNFEPTDWWYGREHTSFKNAYFRLSTLIDMIVN